MTKLNVSLNALQTTEGMDFSYRGTPLVPQFPEHYANKEYVDSIAKSNGRVSAVVSITCDGASTSYQVPHPFKTFDIASVQVYDVNSNAHRPIGIDWRPKNDETIVLLPDVIFPKDMVLRIVITA
ncbi:MAG: hypothetical protein LBT05_10085 [Planctomycetaceae bacterium]|jgi:hypothetical protein|nr:hypothetical protein [Planctomycetaceae bacterium]